MPRISVDTTSTEIVTAFPAGTWAISHIHEIELTTSKVKEDPDTGASFGGSPMAVLTWELDEGPFKGRHVGYHYVMLGGETRKGDPMPVRQLCELIEGVKAPWAANASAPLVARPFKWVKDDRGVFFPCDPDTGSRLVNVDCEMPEAFLNKQARVKYGARKQQGGDRMFNEVAEVKPLP